MLERLREVPGTVFDRAGYHADFDREVEKLTGIIWKLERAQEFREPDDPAWEAFTAGQWQRALDVFENERGDIRAEVEQDTQRGIELRRLRVVEHPVVPYLQWEMHSFKVLAECGVAMRVIDAERVRHLERTEPLPEVVVLGDRVLYEVRYDDTWAACGARRIDDPTLIGQGRQKIASLYEQGEPLLDYFTREIAPLPPP